MVFLPTSREETASLTFTVKESVLNDGVSTVPLNIELCPIKKEEATDRDHFTEEEHAPMEVDSPLQLDDADRYLVGLLKTNFESDMEQ